MTLTMIGSGIWSVSYINFDFDKLKISQITVNKRVMTFSAKLSN